MRIKISYAYTKAGEAMFDVEDDLDHRAISTQARVEAKRHMPQDSTLTAFSWTADDGRFGGDIRT
jgi:hypothetical protein